MCSVLKKVFNAIANWVKGWEIASGFGDLVCSFALWVRGFRNRVTWKEFVCKQLKNTVIKPNVTTICTLLDEINNVSNDQSSVNQIQSSNGDEKRMFSDKRTVILSELICWSALNRLFSSAGAGSQSAFCHEQSHNQQKTAAFTSLQIPGFDVYRVCGGESVSFGSFNRAIEDVWRVYES